MTAPIPFLSALELRELYRTRQLSPVEVADTLLERVEQLNSRLTAFITVTDELARNQARSAEQAWADGSAGPLSGVPISIKDLTATRGVRTTRGSLVAPDWVPDFDAPFVERSLGAGAVMLGKTNTPELGWKGDSGNRIVGPTHNPWKLGKTAGGSSGGAGAAVAAGLGPLGQGSDGAGSIRIPSAFCGIYGLKPSFGLVPQFPASAVGDVSHLGPMTRTVRDAALLLNVVAGGDERDRLSWSSGVDYLAACEGDLRGMRVAWSPDLGYATVAPDVRAATERALKQFEELGCIVEEVNPGIDDPWEIAGPLWTCAMAGVYGARLEEVRDKLDVGLLRVVERAAQYSGEDVFRSQQARAAYCEQMRAFMSNYDLLLTPTLPVTAFDAGLDEPPRTDGIDDTPLDWTRFAYPFNLTGQPAATVPCGLGDDGLPIGLQIVGRWKRDDVVLRASACFESVSPWRQLIPVETPL